LTIIFYCANYNIIGLDSKTRGNIKRGSMVKVVQKANQKTGKLTEGIVKEILTKSSSHPFGIKVLLENGTIGRVKEVID
jgi:uncharacterized repeat protein (TIGR03833 family)